MPAILQQEPLIIPAGINDLARFREWSLSGEFPQEGRIDYLRGKIEVDMSPANVQRHGNCKSVIGVCLGALIRERDLGQFFIDQTRVSAPAADLSCEPDFVFVSWKSLESGQVVYRPAPNARDALDQMEIEGGPDLVVEVVSPTSATKDYRRLPPAYFAAGVGEYWLVDPRGDVPVFLIHARGKTEFEPVPAGAEGFVRSTVLGLGFRLMCAPGRTPHTLAYDLQHRPS